MWQCFTVFRKKKLCFSCFTSFLWPVRIAGGEREAVAIKTAASETSEGATVPDPQHVRVVSGSTHICSKHLRPRDKAKFVHIKVQPLFLFGGSWIVVKNYNTEYVSYGQSLIIVHVLKSSFAWKPVSPVSREIAETSLLACGHVQLPAPRAVGADLD